MKGRNPEPTPTTATDRPQGMRLARQALLRSVASRRIQALVCRVLLICAD